MMLLPWACHVEINAADFAVDPCGAYKGVARWASPQPANLPEGCDSEDKAGSPPAKRFKAEIASGDSGAQSTMITALETPVVPNRDRIASKHQNRAGEKQMISKAGPSEKTALGFVHKRPNSVQVHQQHRQPPAARTLRANAESQTESIELPVRPGVSLSSRVANCEKLNGDLGVRTTARGCSTRKRNVKARKSMRHV